MLQPTVSNECYDMWKDADSLRSFDKDRLHGYCLILETGIQHLLLVSHLVSCLSRPGSV